MISIFSNITIQRCDGDQSKGQDPRCSEKGSAHKLEEDWSDSDQVPQVQFLKSKKCATLKQEEGYKWRRSSSRVLGARGGEQSQEEEEGR